MEVQIILDLVLLLQVIATAVGEVLMVSPSPASCTRYREPCHTLSEYAHNIDKYVSDNTKFVFLPGTHYLDTDIRVSNISSLVLLGDNSSLPELSSRVVCNSSATMVAIIGVSLLFISTLEVTSYGESVTVSVDSVDNFTLISFHLLNSTNLHIYNSTALLENTLFSLGTGQNYEGIAMIQSNITLSKSTDVRNIINSCNCSDILSITNSTLTILPDTNINFTGNSGTAYGLHVESSTNKFREGLLYIADSVANLMSHTSLKFKGNDATVTGGALFMYNSTVLKCSSYALVEFTGNNAIGKLLYNSTIIYSLHTTMEFTGNSGSTGAAFSLQNSVLNFSSNTTMLFGGNSAWAGGAIYLSDSVLWFSSHTSIEFVNNTAESCGGALYLSNSRLSFSPHSSIKFTGNSAGGNGGAIGLYNSKIEFSKSEDKLTTEERNSMINLSFRGNRAGRDGGAIYISNSELQLSSHSTLEFIGNVANRRGGAVHEEDLSPSLYCYSINELPIVLYCFFQVPQHYSDIRLVFSNNSAYLGSDIYGGMIDLCKLDSTEISTDAFDHITGNRKLGISSPSYQLCYCNETTNDCIDDNPHNFTVHPGETISIPVLTMGQRQGPSPAKVVAYSAENRLQSINIFTSNICSALNYTLTSKNLSEKYILLVEDCVSSDSVISVPLYPITITFKNCSPFFEMDSGICECVMAVDQYIYS